MAITSYLTPDLVLSGNLRVSTATISDLQYYNSAAYRRMEQVYKGDQDSQLTNVMFPKASIEILMMLEQSWWPQYVTKAAKTTLWQTVAGQLVTGFDPTKLVHQNQWLIELECFQVIARFYQSLITDNANKNEKDNFNYEIAQKRFDNRWNDAMESMSFYDVDVNGTISKIEENNDIDSDFYASDRRYF